MPAMRIQIGPFEIERLGDCEEASDLVSRSAAPWASPLVARGFDDQPLPEVALEFLNGPSRFAQWPMNRVMSLIGSSGGCKFRLADPSVSSFHCSLLRTHLGLWIVDLLGSLGHRGQRRIGALCPTQRQRRAGSGSLPDPDSMPVRSSSARRSRLETQPPSVTGDASTGFPIDAASSCVNDKPGQARFFDVTCKTLAGVVTGAPCHRSRLQNRI